ncbi:MAG: hypothetical protein AVDCRST_MAG69-580 [uncultured Solirubrobacteraceae bacterium]|uniref:Serine aminopeptidase S33 domain-containing protein n=1 Tax=uncultured Solirubrobacteraceae bacterium TaxID=1162706 RepID=A0A6J4RXT8_9ACTN|nr:MAG: hypothetical protein AVDCRST_MAG69-580 [uncultured Solirubrobacteraceae bacterium]
MHSLLYFPSRTVTEPPTSTGPPVENMDVDTADGERLHAWWVAAPAPTRGHVLLCHGNAGNITSRMAHARLLCGLGFDVMLFDYRGYGRSSGSPSEEGTYRDARAARAALLRRSGVDPRRVFYLGESLGAAVALELALETPPAGLILQSPFTSVRDMARAVYRVIPQRIVPDAYPSRRIIHRLRSPLLILHGEDDEIVPVEQGRALHAAAPGPKRIEVFAGARHNDLLILAGNRWAAAIATWADDVLDAG